ncbi:ribosomal RNA large subunit methyltransferase A [unidentified eubacterium SCB49]|nr:ribosomal RNA large subunit methyltransferase A [unidentified eubacterium SCB49]
MSILTCPYCNTAIQPANKTTYRCENNHSFDLAKQGYLNLLPVNKKKSKDPGDNEMMILARRNFLELGFYDPLILRIKKLINEQLSFRKKAVVALDAGCGEGYYSEKALNHLHGLHTTIYGTDISKHAVKNAAKKYKNNTYFVSSIYDLPIAKRSTHLILSVFSPIMPAEFKRILSSKGYAIVVSPASNHLNEMAALIYETVKPHTTTVVENMSVEFDHVLAERCTFTIAIKNAEDLLALLKMTPYYWSTGIERLENITNKNELSVTCDFNIDIFQKKRQQ